MAKTQIRNFCIIAHIDHGKSTLADRFLEITETIKPRDFRDQVLDDMDLERERGITIKSHPVQMYYRNEEGEEYTLYLIDTPGHVDFTIEVERSLRVIDGMVALFCAVGGVEPQSETVWNQADRYRVPRIGFINKMDRTGADYCHVVDQMNKYLDANAFPFQIPIGEEDSFEGICDIIERKAYSFTDSDRIEKEIPEALKPKCEEARAKLVEKVAEFNNEIMDLYFDEADIPASLLKSAARDATLKLLITPVFCGAAYKNKGIQLLLDAVLDYLPSPIDVGAVVGTDLDDPAKTHTCHPSPTEPFSALSFKLIHDPFVGQLNEDGANLTSVELTDAVISGADAVVILTDHTDFDYGRIVEHAEVLIDARHVAPRTGRHVGSGWIVKS